MQVSKTSPLKSGESSEKSSASNPVTSVEVMVFPALSQSVSVIASVYLFVSGSVEVSRKHTHALQPRTYPRNQYTRNRVIITPQEIKSETIKSVSVSVIFSARTKRVATKGVSMIRAISANFS